MNFSKLSIFLLSSLGFSSILGTGIYFSSGFSKESLAQKFDGKIVFSKINFLGSTEDDSLQNKSFYVARLLNNEEYNRENEIISKSASKSQGAVVKKEIDNSIFFDISYPINKQEAWKILIDIEFKTLEEVKLYIKEKLVDFNRIFSHRTVEEIKSKFSIS